MTNWIRSAIAAWLMLLAAVSIGGRTSRGAGLETLRLARAVPPSATVLGAQFDGVVRPFLETYCVECHSSAEPEADLDLERYVDDGSGKDTRWGLILEKLEIAARCRRRRRGAAGRRRARPGGRVVPRPARLRDRAQRRRPRRRAGAAAEQRGVRLHDPRPDRRRHPPDAASSRSTRPTRPASTTPANRWRCRRRC